MIISFILEHKDFFEEWSIIFSMLFFFIPFITFCFGIGLGEYSAKDDLESAQKEIELLKSKLELYEKETDYTSKKNKTGIRRLLRKAKDL